jgi:hypothetical protein
VTGKDSPGHRKHGVVLAAVNTEPTSPVAFGQC